MRRFLPPILAILALVPCGFAIVDVNNNGLSDYWERQYNNGNLFSASFDPQSDDDGDGWSNAKEAVSGTDPLDGTPPDGLLTPEATHHPSVWVDTDDDGIADTQTIETAEVKWPSLIGKQYQLYGSADLMPETWLEVDEPRMGTDYEIGLIIPLVQPDGSIPERLFWRVAVWDVDTDGDGLTDHEEHQFGTNPNLPMTFPGIPDAWLAANFPSAQGFDPDDDPDGDGITNARENQLGLDPNSHNPIGLANPRFNEEITDEPTLSFRVEYPSDLYEQGSVEGWRADIGGYIEIWDEDDGNPYVELQSHFGAHGVKQEFDMLPGSRLCFILRYKGRYEFDAYDNAFKVEVEGAEEMLINGNPATVSGDARRHSFMDDDEWEKYSDWHYASVTITAPPGDSGLKPITLTLTPLTTKTYGEDEEEDITYGGFVDLLPVEIKEVSFGGTKYWQLKSDDGNITYYAPHWLDVNGDGTATTNTSSGEKNYPVAFTRKTKPEVGAKFKIAGLPSGHTVKIRASSTQGLQIPETTVTPATDGTIILPLTPASNNLVDSIQSHNADDGTAFKIDWEISIGTGAWSAIGSTKHTVYITMADPINTAAGLMRETLFNLGCRNANGKGATAQEVVDAIYDDFKDRDVERVKRSSGTLDGKGMTFWEDRNRAQGTTEGLLSVGDGACGGWARLFMDVLRSQGIDSQLKGYKAPMYSVNALGHDLDVYFPNYIPRLNNIAAPVILVRKWTLNNNPFAPTNLAGIEGQGPTNDPQSYFTDHALVEYGGKLYDPSYGSDPFNNQQEWEDASLDAFGVNFTNSLPNEPELWIEKADPKGSIETQPAGYSY